MAGRWRRGSSCHDLEETLIEPLDSLLEVIINRTWLKSYKMAAGVSAHIFRRLWGFVLSFFGILSRCFKKLICRTKRGRKNSGSLLPLTANHISTPTNIQQSVPSNTEMDLQSWDSWGADDVSFNRSNGSGAQGDATSRFGHRSQLEPTEEAEVDYFQDMAPEFRKAAKIVKRKKEDNYTPSGMSSRLAFTSDIPTQDGGLGDLGTWDESENAWGDEISEDLSWEAQEAIKERKRLDRERRQQEQQRKKMQRDSTKVRKDSGGTGFQAVRLS